MKFLKKFHFTFLFYRERCSKMYEILWKIFLLGVSILDDLVNEKNKQNYEKY